MPERVSWLSAVARSPVLIGLAAGVAGADAAHDPDVTGAPVPGMESGQIAGECECPSFARTLAHRLLFIPRVVVEVVLIPVRGLVWLFDRYELADLYDRAFFNRDHTLGIVPVIEYQTGFGLTVGARLIDTNVFGEHEHLTIEGGYGGTYQARAAAWLDTGTRVDPLVLRLGGNFERFAHLPFYGIGNNELGPRPPMRVDPLTNSAGFETHYRYQELRAVLAADLRVIDGLHLVGSVALTDLTYGPSTSDTPIDAVYDPAGLVGFEQGAEHVYGELELRWDRRRIARPRWETPTYTTGWLASAFVGRVHELEAGSDFTHYGVDVQGFIHVGLGPRVLVLRLWGEGVTGSLDEVPFSELPYLGGDLLRGHDFARYRDRVSALGTAQYVWDLSRFSDAFLFVDAGRVYSSVDALSVHELRFGYGVGISLHSETSYLIAGTLASSSDGGVFLTATLKPLWNETPRWR